MTTLGVRTLTAAPVAVGNQSGHNRRAAEAGPGGTSPVLRVSRSQGPVGPALSESSTSAMSSPVVSTGNASGSASAASSVSSPTSV